MNKQRLYIHIGTPKTGSTAIQKFLKKNPVLLKKHNITYLKGKAIFDPSKIKNSQDETYLAECKFNLENIANEKVERLGQQTFVISSEGYGNPMAGYAEGKKIAQYLRQITPMCQNSLHLKYFNI